MAWKTYRTATNEAAAQRIAHSLRKEEKVQTKVRRTRQSRLRNGKPRIVYKVLLKI